MSLVVVETYPNTMQAHIARGLLESHGIHATILHEHSLSTASFTIGEVPLMVDEENYIRAREILTDELPPDPMESFSA